MNQERHMKSTHNRSSTRWLCAALLVASMTGTLLAEPNDVGDIAANGQVVDPNMGQVDATGNKITFVAFKKDSTIRDGLRLLAALCKKNIVPAAGVDGSLTVSRLYDVTFEEALDAILGYGFKYKQEGSFIRVYTTEQYKKIQEDPDRMVHKVITLYYLTAEEAKKLVEPVLSGSANAKVQFSTIAETEISESETGVGKGEGGGNDPANHDMLVIYDYPENIERAEAVVREADARPKQVLIEATIMSARLAENMEFGIDWNLLTGTPITGYPATINGYGTKAETAGFAGTPGGQGLTIGFSADNVQAIITALETVTDTTLLANPKILAVNKQEGVVYIGKKIGYMAQKTQSDAGSVSSSVDFLETGTRLAFRPYIGNDGYIRMDIYPKDSTGDLQENDIPFEQTTELRTNVVVKDGETVIIGGLFRDLVTTTKQQVPVLGSLPLVGVLFRGTHDSVERQEVFIVLTPHIIDTPGEACGNEALEETRRAYDSALDNLQVLDGVRLAEDAYARAARAYLEGDVEKAMFNLKVSLQMRPTYLDALRLRERIIAETDPEEFRRLDTITTREVEKMQAEK